ncbi:hypothetical protein Patl1_30582 [Pistacia atlantica]|uniref:Uncharacterized protein n=1 Tax=Pistacia atlantica TaxID=434234 RepID=A0ACC1AAV7_9ROSI|nr:hypothetical protein Patl1_30582 [Pistacia atlantica]
MSSSYHPQSDGQTEVVNQTLEQYLCCFAGDQLRKWLEGIPWAEFNYNTSTHSFTKMTPFEAVYDIPPPSLLAYYRALLASKLSMSTCVTEMLSYVSCDITFCWLSLLRKHLGPVTPTSTQLPPVSDTSTVLPQPKVVLDRRVIRKVKYRPKSEILVKWVGAPAEDATWENEWCFTKSYPDFILVDKDP